MKKINRTNKQAHIGPLSDVQAEKVSLKSDI